MWPRPFWSARLEAAWSRRSVIWLMGVRRAGKTVLCQSIPNAELLDCELPRVRALLHDPEAFFAERGEQPVVLDGIHRLPNPSEVLKIAADHFPRVRIIATGSSTLAASARFRDTLAGRKEELWLTPMVYQDAVSFTRTNLEHRMLRGGLPAFFESTTTPEREYQEWLDAFWARDLLELFRLERRAPLLKFLELLFVDSGGLFQATRFATPCEVSRPTIMNYLAALEATFVVHVLRPFSRRRSHEIVATPRVYGFDTGFICHVKGWTSLRPEDRGFLWEHLVLNELHACMQSRNVQYWRTKGGREIDFVFAPRGRPPMAIECKWAEDAFEADHLEAFRSLYPEGDNIVVAADVDTPHSRKLRGLTVPFIGLRHIQQLFLVADENTPPPRESRSSLIAGGSDRRPRRRRGPRPI